MENRTVVSSQIRILDQVSTLHGWLFLGHHLNVHALQVLLILEDLLLVVFKVLHSFE